MTLENILVLAILAGAVLLFISERLRVDVVALIVLAALILTGLVTPEEAFSGFASPAVITVWSVFIISGAIVRTGVADILASFLLQLVGNNPARMTAVIMLTVGGMSAFMNNIGAVAILLPAVISVARKTNTPPSKLLIPLSFASLLGGNMTLIGTPPNILAASILQDYPNVPTFNFFDFFPTGILVLSAGVLYMAFIGTRLLPNRSPGGDVVNSYQIRDYLGEVKIGLGSNLIGKTIQESKLGENFGLNVIHIYSEGQGPLFSDSDHRLQANDVLLVEGTPSDLLTASQASGLETLPGSRIDQLLQENAAGNIEIVEVTLSPDSRLSGKTLREIEFRSRYGLNVLAVRRAGKAVVTRLGNLPLQFGDAMLLEGAPEKIGLLRQSKDFLVLEPTPLEARRTRKAPVAIAVALGVLVSVTVLGLPVAAGMFLGALLMVLSGALSMDEAYQSIEWKSVFLIAAMLPLGLAMENSGTAQLLADQITNLMGGLGPRAVMIGIFLMTALLTEVMSNAAATVLVVPIAIDAALGIGVDPRTYVMGVVIAASTSFLMPIGHQVNVLVFGPGGYRFSDYTKVGVWLNIIILLIVAIALPIIWPF